MPICKGRTVIDTVGKGKIPFYNTDNTVSEKYYHLAILCTRENINGNDLCGLCIEKERKFTTCKISKANALSGATHPSILHGRQSDPIPLWSHIEGGEWFKKMLIKGYKKEVEMAKKNEAKVVEVVQKETVKGTKKKNAASTAANVVVASISKPTFMVDPVKKDEAYDIVELTVRPITIDNVKYYYEPNKNKVYTLKYDYVGRYSVKDEILHTEYPDSDCEPNIYEKPT